MAAQKAQFVALATHQQTDEADWIVGTADQVARFVYKKTAEGFYTNTRIIDTTKFWDGIVDQTRPATAGY